MSSLVETVLVSAMLPLLSSRVSGQPAGEGIVTLAVRKPELSEKQILTTDKYVARVPRLDATSTRTAIVYGRSLKVAARRTTDPHVLDRRALSPSTEDDA
jgi:hypothetical protein